MSPLARPSRVLAKGSRATAFCSLTAGATLATVLCTAETAMAGMPSPTISDVGGLRLQSIGFFLALFVVLAKLFQVLWNWIRKDLPALPVLSLRRAMGIVFLWGIALELVLTMVSGARELLTPGAWEKVGVTYQVKPDAPGTAVTDSAPSGRRARLERLANALRSLKTLPRSARTSGLPNDVWMAPGGARYVYVGEIASSGGIVAYEPPGLGDERLVILRDFAIVSLTTSDLERRMTEAAP